MQKSKISEAALRRRVRNSGFEIRKSRQSVSLNNFGGYMLVDVAHNLVLLGRYFEASLLDIDKYVSRN